MLFSNPRTLPALLLCVGFGLAVYRWYELQHTPAPDPQEIELAVELNYALDLARAENAGKPTPGAQQRVDEKAKIRAEIEEFMGAERETLQTQMTQGLVAGFLGLALYLGVLALQRRGVIK